KYVENVVLKATRSDVAALYTIIYTKNNPYNYSFKPGEINQRLANDILNTIQQNNYHVSAQQPESGRDPIKRFMHPQDLREKVLKNLEDQGILLHLEGKEARKKRHPGKPSKKSDRGGKPSLYIATQDFEKLKKAMNKFGALDFLHDKVIKTGLAFELAKYLFQVIFYTAKMDEQVAQKLMGIGASFFQSKVTENNSSKSSALHQMLQTMDDDQLEQYADNIAKSLIEVRGFYSLLFLPGLLKL
ncbi:MAG TPA: hypothetical protein VIP70_06195, partial [Nitrososphaeraceae archaeon]